MKRILPIAIASILAGAGAWLLACGPWLVELQPVMLYGPADAKAYARGDLGIVRPTFTLAYQLQAYRALTSRSAAIGVSRPAQASANDGVPEPIAQWQATSNQLLGTPHATVNPWRHIPGDAYETFTNCPDSAFTSALRTFDARSQRFGARSAEFREWVRAQVAVFANCDDVPLVLPAAAPAGADALIRADRAYQTAAAYFYATDYETAASRFDAIADDTTSPWRPFGRYLAARANIRLATVRGPDGHPDHDRLVAAESRLRAVLADPSAAALHASARGLLGFTSARLRPLERLHELSKRLTSARAPDEQDAYDYRYLFNAMFVAGASAPSRVDIVRGDDLSDWLLSMRRRDEVSQARAIERWRESRAPHWLVAALWQTDAPGADANDLLDAARLLDRQSPAFPTVAFLRVRLLAALGRWDEARDVLASLPNGPSPGFNAETINVLKAERMMLAQTLDEFLEQAPRAIVITWDGRARIPNGDLKLRARSHDEPVLDQDATIALNEQLPLTRLADAAISTRLPRRLRTRVAMAALTRAIVLGRDDEGTRLLPLLRELAPALKVDLDRYERASSASDRRRAGIFLLLNTPGATVDVRGKDNDYSFEVVEPAREFDHVFRKNWWCAVPTNRTWGVTSFHAAGLRHGVAVQPPSFVSPAELDTAARERQAIAALGPARGYLAETAIQLATATPGDPAAAQALARVVEGWRWACYEDEAAKSDASLPQRAFNVLHRLFPNSAAARQTPYWYKS